MGDDEPAALRGILDRAGAETRELGHGYIGSEHLLLALLSTVGSRAARRLEAAGGRYDDVRARIVRIVGSSDEEIAVEQTLPFAPHAIAVVRRVREEAERAGPEAIGTEHIRRAVLSRRDSVAVRVLEDCAVHTRVLAAEPGARDPTRTRESDRSLWDASSVGCRTQQHSDAFPFGQTFSRVSAWLGAGHTLALWGTRATQQARGVHGRHWRLIMKRIVLSSAVLLAWLAVATPAKADPVKSPNSQVVVFTCAGGVSFSVVTISQNQSSAAQVLDGGSGVFHLTRVVSPDGTTVFEVPGQANKTQVTGCTTSTFPGFVGEGFLSP